MDEDSAEKLRARVPEHLHLSPKLETKAENEVTIKKELKQPDSVSAPLPLHGKSLSNDLVVTEPKASSLGRHVREPTVANFDLEVIEFSAENSEMSNSSFFKETSRERPPETRNTPDFHCKTDPDASRPRPTDPTPFVEKMAILAEDRALSAPKSSPKRPEAPSRFSDSQPFNHSIKSPLTSLICSSSVSRLRQLTSFQSESLSKQSNSSSRSRKGIHSRFQSTSNLPNSASISSVRRENASSSSHLAHLANMPSFRKDSSNFSNSASNVPPAKPTSQNKHPTDETTHYGNFRRSPNNFLETRKGFKGLKSFDSNCQNINANTHTPINTPKA